MIDCAILISGCFFYFNIMTEKEIWEDVPGYEGYYKVSNLGRVRSLDRVITYKSGASKLLKGKILNPTMNNGYKQVTLAMRGRQKTFKFSQLVAMAFLGHTPNGHTLVIDHIDGDRSCDRLGNLRIVTHRANVSTCFRTDNGAFSSEYVGVSFNKNAKKWNARIKSNGRNVHLGCFDDELEASHAYQLALAKVKNGSFNPNDYKPKYSSKYKGVNFHNRDKNWQAQMTINGKRKFLGYFKTEKEAYEARQKALKEYI